MKPQNWDRMPLSMNLASQPFGKWGLDFVGPVSLGARKSCSQYIIVATDYFTKWAKRGRLEKPMQDQLLSFCMSKCHPDMDAP